MVVSSDRAFILDDDEVQEKPVHHSFLEHSLIFKNKSERKNALSLNGLRKPRINFYLTGQDYKQSNLQKSKESNLKMKRTTK